MKKYVYIILLLMLFNGCREAVPDQYVDMMTTIRIEPDYRDTVIPCNIAPLNFRIQEEADDYLTCISGSSGEKLYCYDRDVKVELKLWRSLLDANKGSEIKFEIYLKKQGIWYKYPVIKNSVSANPIDGYLSYRLIEPSYVTYGELSIRQRDLTSFDECDIYNNQVLGGKGKSQCINCHSYQNYRTDHMQFHGRGDYGGTVIASGGKLRKVNLKTEETVSGGVYPAWHPVRNLIAYSVNKTGQLFHSKDLQKVEVQDTYSGLVLYDVDSNRLTVVLNDSNSLATFPSWSPDGRMLYYAAAFFRPSGKDRSAEMGMRYRDLKYNIMRIPFDAETMTFGSPDTVYNAAMRGRSATFPRVSPDGNYLLFTEADYGTFHIWHKSADLYLMNLRTKSVRPLEEVNSRDVESYHSWSSNGRWIVFSSRRDDGSYTRPYIAGFTTAGRFTKPFILPQEETGFYACFLKSFNIPEFMVEPVKFSVREFAGAFQGDAIYAEPATTSDVRSNNLSNTSLKPQKRG